MKKPPTNYDDLLGRVKKYINVKEAQIVRKNDLDPAGLGMSRLEKMVPHPNSCNSILRPFLNYAIERMGVEKTVQVLEEEGPLRRSRGYVRRPPPCSSTEAILHFP